MRTRLRRGTPLGTRVRSPARKAPADDRPIPDRRPPWRSPMPSKLSTWLHAMPIAPAVTSRDRRRHSCGGRGPRPHLAGVAVDECTDLHRVVAPARHGPLGREDEGGLLRGDLFKPRWRAEARGEPRERLAHGHRAARAEHDRIETAR